MEKFPKTGLFLAQNLFTKGKGVEVIGQAMDVLVCFTFWETYRVAL